MALDFPSSPALNQVYTFGSYSWRWDGTSWVGAVPIVNATINNTTIGATTPSTGAFTSLTSTSGAFNGTVGATTASTGAFTTLSASGLITATTTTTSAALFTGTNSATSLQIKNTGANPSDWIIQSGGTGTKNLSFYNVTDGAYVATLSSTGLAVTGALSSTTGANFATSSGNVGVGLSSPAYKFQVQGAAGSILSWTDGTTPGTLYSGGGYVGLTFPAGTGGFFINTSGNFNTISTNGIERLRVDSSGNVGIGVTPSANTSGGRALEIGTTGAGIFGAGGASNNCGITSNAYGSNYHDSGGWKYARTGTAGLFEANGSNFYWMLAASGTAGNAITFTQAMTLDASGNLGIGTSLFGSDGNVVPRLAVANPSNSDKFVGIGYDNTGDYGFIHAIHRATAWKNLILQGFGGNVGIGTSSPAKVLDVNGTVQFRDAAGGGQAFWVANKGIGSTNSGAFGLGYNAVNFTPGSIPSALLWDPTSGWFTILTSSRKYKRNIVAVTDEQLDKALLLKPSYYQRNEYEYHEYGFIAEEVNEIGLDEFVTRYEGEISGLAYDKMVTLAIGLAQRQAKENANLVAQVAALSQRLAALESK